MIRPLNAEFGWPLGTISTAVSVNLLLYGLTAPFAAALMERFGIRRVIMAALVLVAAAPIVLGFPRTLSEATTTAPAGVRFRDRLREWTHPRLIALGVLVFGVELAEGSARTWMPLAVERDLHQPDAIAALFVTLFPDVMPSTTAAAFNLTVHNASSTPYTLTVMTWVAVAFTPIVLCYQGWTYWVFRKRLTLDRIPAADRTVS